MTPPKSRAAEQEPQPVERDVLLPDELAGRLDDAALRWPPVGFDLRVEGGDDDHPHAATLVSAAGEPLLGWTAGEEDDVGLAVLRGVRELLAEVAPALPPILAQLATEHAPVYRSGTRGRVVLEPACPECVGVGDDSVRACGCFGFRPAVCRTCAILDAGPSPLPTLWPCPSWVRLCEIATLLDGAP